jgi:hypothetical protein
MVLINQARDVLLNHFARYMHDIQLFRWQLREPVLH